jgi:hypothetical protein
MVFSEIIEAEDEDEHDWLIKVATLLWGAGDGPSIQSWPKKADDLLSVPFEDVYGLMPMWKPIKRKRGIVVYSMEGCAVHAIPPLIQLYLRKYHRDWYWWLEWAEICERPSPGGFRGGAVFVTGQHVAWHFTAHWVNGMIERTELQHG